MERPSCLLSVALSWLTLAAATAPLCAQQPTAEETTEPAAETQSESPKTQDEGTDEPAERSPKRQARPGSPSSPQRLYAQVAKLRALMLEKIELHQTQRKIIEALFERQLAGIRAGVKESRRPRDRKATLKEARALQQELIEARKSGDKKRAHQLRQQLRQTLKRQREYTSPGVGPFLAEVGGQLDESQKEVFLRLVKLLGLEARRGPRADPVRQLMRAVLAPDIGLSPEQRRAVRLRTRAQFLEPMNAGADRKERERHFAKLRADVLAELTPEQRAKVEAKLAQANERSRPGADKPTEPADSEPAEAKPAETEPVETEPVKTEPEEIKPIETEPAETEPTAEKD